MVQQIKIYFKNVRSKIQIKKMSQAVLEHEHKRKRFALPDSDAFIL